MKTTTRLLLLLCSVLWWSACEKPIFEEDVGDTIATENVDNDDNDNQGNADTDTDDTPVVSVSDFIGKEYQGKVWVKGCIVGNCHTHIGYADFFPPFKDGTALLLADEPLVTDPTRVIAIQLKKGKIRDCFSLVYHPLNFGREAAFKGTQKTYMGIPGMKDDISAYKLYDWPDMP